MPRFITVVTKAPFKDPVEKVIPDTVEAIQQEVHGYFEAHRLGPFTLYCDDEGRMPPKLPNIVDECHGVFLLGDVLVMKGDNGLKPEEVTRAMDLLTAATHGVLTIRHS